MHQSGALSLNSQGWVYISLYVSFPWYCKLDLMSRDATRINADSILEFANQNNTFCCKHPPHCSLDSFPGSIRPRVTEPHCLSAAGAIRNKKVLRTCWETFSQFMLRLTRKESCAFVRKERRRMKGGKKGRENKRKQSKLGKPLGIQREWCVSIVIMAEQVSKY